MSRYPDNGAWAVERRPLQVGQRLKFGSDRWWWTVRAATENFAAVTRPERFRPAGTLCYSVLDWRNGVRGPCNLVFGWYGSLDEQGCAALLTEFEGGKLEVSQRNWVAIDIATVQDEP